MSETLNHTTESFSLKLDNGVVMDFEGQYFAETSWFVEEDNSIKRQRIYTTEEGAQVYSITEGDGISHSHRAYRVELSDNIMHINDGKSSLEIDKDLFLSFAKFLLDKVETSSDNTIEHIDELLRAANS